MYKYNKMSLQYSPIVPPKDKFVELYNGLWLKIREQKNTLSQWISNVFDKVEAVDKKLKKLDRYVDIELECANDRIDELERTIYEMRTEMRDELLQEIREEMRA